MTVQSRILKIKASKYYTTIRQSGCWNTEYIYQHVWFDRFDCQNYSQSYCLDMQKTHQPAPIIRRMV